MDKLIDDDSDSCLTDLDNSFQAPTVCISSDVTWQPVFLVVTDRHLLIFPQAPQTLADWSLPSASAALVATRAIAQIQLTTDKKDLFGVNHLSNFEQGSFCLTIRTGKNA